MCNILIQHQLIANTDRHRLSEVAMVLKKFKTQLTIKHIIKLDILENGTLIHLALIVQVFWIENNLMK